MAYSEKTEYPRGIQTSDLTSAVIFADDVAIRVAHIIVANSAVSATTVTFTDTAGSPVTRFTVQVPASSTVVLPSFFADSAGFRADADAATTFVTVFSYSD